jgi:D-3-phosphoglycerate dehydrogenase
MTTSGDDVAGGGATVLTPPTDLASRVSELAAAAGPAASAAAAPTAAAAAPAGAAAAPAGAGPAVTRAASALRILNAEPLNYSAEARAVLARLGTVTERALTRAELREQLADYDVLIVRLAHRIDRELLESAPRLKVVVSATTGLDHIDVACARSRGVAVLSLKGETRFLRTVGATAEHTWALLLALLRNIAPAAQAVRDGAWNRDAFRGRECAGKRLGIVGFGRVGEKVARFGAAFGMAIGAFDPRFHSMVRGLWCAKTLLDLLGWSDVVSLHVPLTPETEHMIGREELERLPKGAMLVNTSRGEVLDEPALVAALESGHLAGAAVDVMCHERDEVQRRQSPLLAYASTHQNLLITPHIAGATIESMPRTEVFMARKLEAFLSSGMASRGST